MRDQTKNYVSLILNICVFVITGICLIYSILFGGDGNMALEHFSIFYFFTLQSNLFVAAVSLIMIPYNIKNIKNDTIKYPRWLLLLKYISTCAVGLTFVTVVCFLGFIYTFTYVLSDANFFYHLITPLLAFFGLVLCEPGKISKKEMFLGTLPMVIYGIVYLLNVLVFKVWPDVYYFTFGGKLFMAPVSYAVMFGVTLAISYGIYKLHQYFTNNGVSYKLASLLLFLFFYFLAYMIGYAAAIYIENIYIQLIVFDVVATIVIWAISLVVRNSSVYDAYWSLTPMVLAFYLIVRRSTFSLPLFIIFICFELWGLRLTINWIKNFADLTWEDWRYQNYRKNLSPAMWHVANFFGIQMMPTIFVFLGFLPFIALSQLEEVSYLSLIGAVIIIIGTCFELFADLHMRKFLKLGEKRVCDLGLWRFSRHPNYLGEILIWVGLYVAMMLTIPSYWYLGAGMLIIFLMFEFISIPMMEKRQLSRRSDYKEYQKKTSRLLPLPRRK